MSSRPGPQGNLVVLKLRKRNLGRFSHTIYQEDLEELLLKRRRAAEAGRDAECKEEFIRAALLSGARVEDGVHTAELLNISRKSYQIRPGSFTKLVVI